MRYCGFLLWVFSNTGTDCQERLWSLLSWILKTWLDNAACSAGHLFEPEHTMTWSSKVRASTVLRLCDSVFWILMHVLLGNSVEWHHYVWTLYLTQKLFLYYWVSLSFVRKLWLANWSNVSHVKTAIFSDHFSLSIQILIVLIDFLSL